MIILGKKISMEYKLVFCNIKKQSLRLTTNVKLLGTDYAFIGHMTEVEFDLLLEAMFHKFCMNDVDFEVEDAKLMLDRIRNFCNEIKNEFDNL